MAEIKPVFSVAEHKLAIVEWLYRQGNADTELLNALVKLGERASPLATQIRERSNAFFIVAAYLSGLEPMPEDATALEDEDTSLLKSQ